MIFVIGFIIFLIGWCILRVTAPNTIEEIFNPPEYLKKIQMYALGVCLIGGALMITSICVLLWGLLP